MMALECIPRHGKTLYQRSQHRRIFPFYFLFFCHNTFDQLLRFVSLHFFVSLFFLGLQQCVIGCILVLFFLFLLSNLASICWPCG